MSVPERGPGPRPGPKHGIMPFDIGGVSSSVMSRALDLPGTGLLAIVGAGGKTSLMFRLATELTAGGARVACTTTTRIFPPAPDQVRLILGEDNARFLDCLLYTSSSRSAGIVDIQCFEEPLSADHEEMARLLDERESEIAVMRKKLVKYEAIFQGLSDGVLLLDEKLSECNREACQIWRCDQEHIIGFFPSDFAPPIQPGGENSYEMACRKINEAYRGNIQKFEWKDLRRDGILIDTQVILNRIEVDLSLIHI